jgi:tellurite resistance protein
VLFGLGLICWLILGSMIMARPFFRPPLPDPLAPTMAIDVAPAAVASLAYFAIYGDHLGPFISGIGGYGLLMVLAQIPLLPRYCRLRFMPSFWAFTFAWAAIAETGLIWIEINRPAGCAAVAWLIVAAISRLVVGLAVRSLVALARHQFIPSPVSPMHATQESDRPG